MNLEYVFPSNIVWSPTITFLSNLPDLFRAGSKVSALFVAAKTTTPSSCSKPS